MSGDFAQDLFVDWEEHLQTTLFYVIVPAGHTVMSTNASNNTQQQFQTSRRWILWLFSQNLLDPDERVVKLWIYGLQVFESQWFVQNPLVEREGETRVDEFAMEQGLKRNNVGSSIRRQLQFNKTDIYIHGLLVYWKMVWLP